MNNLMKNSTITISKIISFMRTENFQLQNKIITPLSKFNSLNLAKKGEISFCSTKGKDGGKLVDNSLATFIICHISLKSELKNGKSNYVFVENPRYWYILCMKNFLTHDHFEGIHPTAIIESKIPKSVYIGPYSYIEKNVKIGENTVIQSNVHIHKNSSVGNNCIIDSNSVIGSDGFGYERDNKGKIEMFPHIGGIKIEDDVEIGANVCVDRGTIYNTVIGSGTKIDNLVHIAHNVKIGKNCSIIANSVIAGSCILGDNVHVAMSVTIRDQIKIGKNAVLGMGSLVIKDVSPNVTVIGVPAKPIKK
ncbi:MAG: UDP-3-O-(3-hydroxymyristoyl)glucosamine N-acyltransferase [Nitrosopumilus sp.]|nr:UDP-3-O-(3-hydroxymyristoyl)glucosamine N-acyltransferase [Nitrosopumilus sp.]NRA04643.1 UDP-3-O-(3-hydroxymyristoyl)glucosamine N-acyltransferase [Nitrosopumilus sp.]